MTSDPAEMSIAEVEADLDAVLERVEMGEAIVVTRDGRPVVCIRPLPVYPDRGFGVLDALPRGIEWPR